MKRTWKQVLDDALQLLWEDLKNMWIALGAAAVYLTVMTQFFYTSCPFRMVTGFPCPGCGLTRAGMSLLHFDFSGAWKIHPMIYPIVLLAFIFVVRRYFLRKNSRILIKYAVLLMVVMFLFYVYRMVVSFPVQEPMTYYSGAVLAKKGIAGWIKRW